MPSLAITLVLSTLTIPIFVDVVYGCVSVLLCDEISKGMTVLGFFFPTENALYSIAFGTHTETANPIEMPFAMMSGLGPRNSVICGVTIPEGKWKSLGKTCARQA